MSLLRALLHAKNLMEELGSMQDAARPDERMEPMTDEQK